MLRNTSDVSNNDELCVIKRGICIKNEEFYINDEELCIKNDVFCSPPAG